MSLDVTHQAISKRLHSLALIYKQENWVPYELMPRDVERRLLMLELLLEQQSRKGHLLRIIIGDENWMRYDNLNWKKSWAIY